MPLPGVSLDFIRQTAAKVLAASPVKYVREAVLFGMLFGDLQAEIVSGADTNFWVDHQEPMQVLKSLEGRWPFGNLPKGHEYLLLFERPSTGSS
jgi:hypothetical protein